LIRTIQRIGTQSKAMGWTCFARLFSPPDWTYFARLLPPERLEAFEAIVEAHYRYYQFHSNSLVAMLFSYAAWRPSLGSRPIGSDLGIVFLSAIFFAVSRDNLRRYYGRAAVLLGTLNKEFSHEQRSYSSRVSSILRHPQSAAEAGGDEGADDEEPDP
jgi:hypothetical protein